MATVSSSLMKSASHCVKFKAQFERFGTFEVSMQKSQTPTILITGATGSVGTELTKLLSAQGMPFRAMVRSMEGADKFPR
jgi:NADPH:quinone reductase-like Zn-dependent oxidoreductase